MGDSAYSFSLTTFAPDGQLNQIKHALKAVEGGKTSLGIQASNGVVLATQKKVPSILVEEDSIEKIVKFTGNCGVVYSGMGPDFRVLVRSGQKKAQQYFLMYGVRQTGSCRGWETASPAPSWEPFVSSRSTRNPRHLLRFLQENIPVLELTKEIATVMQEFTQSGGVRPFGVSVLIAGCVHVRAWRPSRNQRRG